MREALFYKKEKGGAVRCRLCPRGCFIQDDRTGLCGVRKNIKGKLFSLVYAKPCAIHLDPVEKKPLFHFLPGEETFSIATVGCNFFCDFCQNWQISKEWGRAEDLDAEFIQTSPEKIVKLCKESGSRIISYTYTEPTIFYEYMLDTARLAKKAGLRNVMVSNGFINEEPLRKLCKYLDAANIDLKGFNDDFYRKICKASLEPVLRTLKILKEEGVWLEITNLVIPGKNDDMAEVDAMAKWIAKELGKETPLHFTRVHPDYKMKDVQVTPLRTLEAAQVVAMKHLTFVYTGNVLKESDTLCPSCQKKLIRREMMNVFDMDVLKGRCPACSVRIAGVWS